MSAPQRHLVNNTSHIVMDYRTIVSIGKQYDFVNRWRNIVFIDIVGQDVLTVMGKVDLTFGNGFADGSHVEATNTIASRKNVVALGADDRTV